MVPGSPEDVQEESSNFCCANSPHSALFWIESGAYLLFIHFSVCVLHFKNIWKSKSRILGFVQILPLESFGAGWPLDNELREFDDNFEV